MKNKGLLLIAGGIAIAAAIIAWLMFGGEAPKNPENTASNAVSAVVKNTTVSREQDGRRLWEFSVEALESISGSGEAPVFQSADDQPWAEYRDQITEIWYDDMEALTIPDLAY